MVVIVHVLIHGFGLTMLLYIKLNLLFFCLQVILLENINVFKNSLFLHLLCYTNIKL